MALNRFAAACAASADALQRITETAPNASESLSQFEKHHDELRERLEKRMAEIAGRATAFGATGKQFLDTIFGLIDALEDAQEKGQVFLENSIWKQIFETNEAMKKWLGLGFEDGQLTSLINQRLRSKDGGEESQAKTGNSSPGAAPKQSNPAPASSSTGLVLPFARTSATPADVEEHERIDREQREQHEQLRRKTEDLRRATEDQKRATEDQKRATADLGRTSRSTLDELSRTAGELKRLLEEAKKLKADWVSRIEREKRTDRGPVTSVTHHDRVPNTADGTLP